MYVNLYLYVILYICQAQVRSDREPPYQTSLVLQLPEHGAPFAPADQLSAFRRIRVQRVEVIRPEVETPGARHSLAQGFWRMRDDAADFFHSWLPSKRDAARPAMSQAYAAHNAQWDVPVPTAVCHALVVLLQGGTTHLAIRGVLKAPDAVAAIADQSRCQLQSIELGDPASGAWACTTASRKSYERLMAGLSICRTLKHLS